MLDLPVSLAVGGLDEPQVLARERARSRSASRAVTVLPWWVTREPAMTFTLPRALSRPGRAAMLPTFRLAAS